MALFWKYLKPYSLLIVLVLVLAGIAQVLALYDPIIFGKIIDDYALNDNDASNDARVGGAVKLLIIAFVIALAARLFTSFKDYFLRMIVQKFG
ncbi:MAG: ABC transporter ATP-binding protein, partial [Pedobacter sp.]